MKSSDTEALLKGMGKAAHDFNNILAVILNYTKVLMDRCRDDQQSRELLLEILEAAKRGEELAGSLLLFSRTAVRENMRPVNLNGLIAEMEDSLLDVVWKNIKLNISAVPSLWTVYAVPELVKHVVINLVRNCVDAIESEGSITIETTNITIDTTIPDYQDMEPGRYVLLSIADDGEGMSHDTQRSSLMPFFTTRSDGKAIGLGLTITDVIVKQLGGSMLIRSRLNKGTTVQVYLPAAE
ncbi:MAG: ATP-binding protein [Pseudomonadota bacterium]